MHDLFKKKNNNNCFLAVYSKRMAHFRVLQPVSNITGLHIPYFVSCRFRFWFSLSTLRKTSLVRLPSPPLPSGGKSGEGGSSGDKLPLEAPTESREAPVSRRPPGSPLPSRVRWLPLQQNAALRVSSALTVTQGGPRLPAASYLSFLRNR